MSKKTLLAIAIAASLTPALAANSANTTSTDSSAPAVSASSSASTSASSVSYKSGPTKRGRGVAFGRGHSGHTLNVSHASAEIANLPMDATSTSITLFGELDAGVKVSKLKGGKTKVQMSNGNWYWTSWGIKGVEDLGGGNAAIFTLQQAFKLNNGEGVASSHGTTSSGGFNNQAFLGLQGPWGRLTFGHQAGLSSGDGDYSMLGGSAIGTGFDMIGDLAGVFLTTSWLDNSIAYRTQEWNGLQFTAMYSNGTDGDDNKWAKNNHYYGVGVTYDVGAFNSNFMFEREDHKSKVAYADGSVKLDPTNYYTLGASYDFGDFTLYGAYQYVSHGTRMPGYNYIHIDKKTGASTTVAEPATKGVNQNAASVSIAAPLWGGTAMLQLNGVKGKIKNTGEKYNAWSIGSGYTYPLSKRTLVYGSINYGDGNKALSESSIDGYSCIFGMATSF